MGGQNTRFDENRVDKIKELMGKILIGGWTTLTLTVKLSFDLFSCVQITSNGEKMIISQ